MSVSFFICFPQTCAEFLKIVIFVHISLYKIGELLYNIMAKVIRMENGETDMALIEYDVYKQKLRDLEPELKKLGDALDIDAVAQEAARLEDETTQNGFWNNLERSQKVQTRLKQLQNKLHRFKKLMSTWEDLTTLCEMGQEAEDEEILEELKTEFPALETEIEEIRMTTLLSGE